MGGPTLSQIVLHLLSKRPQSGYGICKEIEESTGQRPSFGSIYPILDKLSKEGIVTAHIEGRRKIYTLTPKGKAAAADLKEKHAQLIEQMISQSKLFCAITGCDAEPMVSMLERLKAGDNPLEGISTNAIRLRDTLFRLSQQNRIKQNQKEINAILAGTIKRLERL